MALQFPATRRAPDRSAALAQYRRRAASYDTELAIFEPIRLDAVARLGLRRGDKVLDVGCGTGLSFELLHDRIGKGGRILGIEQSPEMLARARERVEHNHWRNVELVCAPAAKAQVPVLADAALFHFTHDVLRNPAALDHVLAHLKPGARVVASGLQWAPPWMVPTNLFVLGAALYSVSSLDGLEQPWTMLAKRLHSFEVRGFPWVGIYVAGGRGAVTSRA
jgi:ubiquinone/menaquinone biosynthesis C-methylase UbiE